jgi:hypothetical protein
VVDAFSELSAVIAVSGPLTHATVQCSGITPSRPPGIPTSTTLCLLPRQPTRKRNEAGALAVRGLCVSNPFGDNGLELTAVLPKLRRIYGQLDL